MIKVTVDLIGRVKDQEKPRMSKFLHLLMFNANKVGSQQRFDLNSRGFYEEPCQFVLCNSGGFCYVNVMFLLAWFISLCK